MKASVIERVGGRFTVEDVQVDEPRGREVLVDVKASGLCHSDLHLATHDYGVPMPAVLGHEVSGVVAAVGPGVTAVRVGDHVAACLVQFCGTCVQCTSGHTYACTTKGATLRAEGEPARLSQDGASVFQGHGIGGFAEQSLVHENQLAVISPEIPFAPASIIGCGTVTGAGAVMNAADVRVGETVAIIGAGGVGLNAVSAARLVGALRVVVVDIDPTKLEVARRFGATDVVDASSADPVEVVRDLVPGGVDHAFEFSGLEVTQGQAVLMARTGGAVHLAGLARPGSALRIPSSLEMLRAHTRIEGVHMGSTNLKRDIPLFVAFYLQGRFNLDDLVSREIALADIPDAYEELGRGGVVRSVVTTF